MGIGCVICTEEFDKQQEKYPAVIKSCGHCFHDECLKKWLNKSKTCPICRVPVIDSSSFIVRLHLQRLSIDNTSFNNLLDEVLELRKKLDEKERELKKKNEMLKEKTAQIKELQTAWAKFKVEVTAIETSLKNLKQIQIEKAALGEGSSITVNLLDSPTTSSTTYGPPQPRRVIRSSAVTTSVVPASRLTCRPVSSRTTMSLSAAGRPASSSSTARFLNTAARRH